MDVIHTIDGISLVVGKMTSPEHAEKLAGLMNRRGAFSMPRKPGTYLLRDVDGRFSMVVRVVDEALNA